MNFYCNSLLEAKENSFGWKVASSGASAICLISHSPYSLGISRTGPREKICNRNGPTGDPDIGSPVKSFIRQLESFFFLKNQVKILEMKNTIIEIESIGDGFNSRLNTTEEKFSDLKDRFTENIQIEAGKSKGWKYRNEHKTHVKVVKISHLQVTGVLERWEGEYKKNHL